MFSPRTNYTIGIMRKANQNKTKTTLCLCANLPRACGLDAACASDSTSPRKAWERCWASGRCGKRDKDGTVSVGETALAGADPVQRTVMKVWNHS